MVQLGEKTDVDIRLEALRVAQGDLSKAKEIYEWLSGHAQTESNKEYFSDWRVYDLTMKKRLDDRSYIGDMNEIRNELMQVWANPQKIEIYGVGFVGEYHYLLNFFTKKHPDYTFDYCDQLVDTVLSGCYLEKIYAGEK